MTENHPKRTAAHPVVIAMAVAIFGLLAMLIVDHGPWSRPNVQTAEVANHQTTGAAGAAVAPTTPRPALEPEAPGPKPAQPASPDPQ